MPDIVSYLSSHKPRLDDGDFRQIVQFVFGFIQTDAETVSLIEKLCHRFASVNNVQQWRDIACCLSMLSFNEKGMKKLYSCAPTFKVSIFCFVLKGLFLKKKSQDICHDDVIYLHFVEMIKKSKNTATQAALEVQKIIDECYMKHHPNCSLPTGEPASKGGAGKKAAGKKGAAGKSKRKRRAAGGDDDDEDEEDDEDSSLEEEGEEAAPVASASAPSAPASSAPTEAPPAAKKKAPAAAKKAQPKKRAPAPKVCSSHFCFLCFLNFVLQKKAATKPVAPAARPKRAGRAVASAPVYAQHDDDDEGDESMSFSDEE